MAATSREARGTLLRIFTAGRGGKSVIPDSEDDGGDRGADDGRAVELELEEAEAAGRHCEPGQRLPIRPCTWTSPALVTDMTLEHATH